MHFIGMEAFHLPMPVKCDWPTVLFSMVAAILASGVTLSVVSLSFSQIRKRADVCI
jgi:two-component system, sensor histidine kinase and response regulator